MKGWLAIAPLYEAGWDSLMRCRDYCDEESPIAARLEQVALLAEIRGEDILLDRLFSDALSQPECARLLGPAVWADAHGNVHTGEPDGRSRLADRSHSRVSRLVTDYDAVEAEQRVWRNARDAVKRAIRKGLLHRPSVCEQCGSGGRIEAAHHDYTKPREVRWLCVSCHRRWDAATPKTARPVVA